MPRLVTLYNLKRKETQMDNNTILIISVLVVTLLNLGLVMLALARLGGLRRDLRTPVVKKFNADFKRKPVDIPKTPENFGKIQRDDKSQQGRAGGGPNRPKNQQQNRPMQVRRPAAKAPDVFSNEIPPQQTATPVPPRPMTSARPAPSSMQASAQAQAPASARMPDQTPVTEGRRPLPPRGGNNNGAPAPSSVQAQTPAPMVAPVAASVNPAPVAPVPSSAASDDGENGMEFDRSKMAHGRRNVVAKPVIEDDETERNPI